MKLWDKVNEAAHLFKVFVEQKLSVSAKKMSDYLDGNDLLGVLNRYIKSNVVDNYKVFYDTIQLEYGTDMFESIVDVETVGKWIDSVFTQAVQE